MSNIKPKNNFTDSIGKETTNDGTQLWLPTFKKVDFRDDLITSKLKCIKCGRFRSEWKARNVPCFCGGERSKYFFWR